MKVANRVFLLALAIVASLSLAGCGKQQCATTQLGSTGTGSGTTGGISTGGTICGPGTNPGGGGSVSVLLYYFALDNTGAGTVEAAGLSNAGSLSLLNPFTPPTLPSLGTDNMVIVNKQFLYIPMGDGTVQAFTITRATGALTPIGGGPFLAAGADTAVSDPKGRFLFVGAEGFGQVTVFKIDPVSGGLTNDGTFTSINMISSDSLTVDGNGQFLYVGQGQTVSPLPIVAASIDQTSGALTEIQGSPFNLGVSTVHADPSGKFLLGVAGVLDASSLATDRHLFVFSIGPTGTPATLSNVQTTSAPFEFAIHPSGQFVYTFGADSTGAIAAVEGYQLTSTGTLTALPNSPFTSLPIVQDCQFDQSGGSAFCVDSIFGGTAFSVLNANPTTGALTNTVQSLTVTNTFPFAVTD